MRALQWRVRLNGNFRDSTTVTGNLTVSPDPSQVIFTEFEEEYCVSPDTPVGTRLFRVEAVVSVEVVG